MTTGEGWEALAALNATLDWDRLHAYVVELERWNRTIRLVGPKDVKGIRVQVEDALLPFLHCSPGFPLLDIGSGAGLPGLVLAITLAPGAGGQVVCLEPLGKRVSFLRHVVRQLKLGNVEVLEERAESAVLRRPDLRGHFRTVTGRAVCEGGELLSLSEPYLRAGGRAILPRGDESPVAQPGWQLEQQLSYEGPPGVGRRTVHVYGRRERGGATARTSPNCFT